MTLLSKPLKLSLWQLRGVKVALHGVILAWLLVTFYAGINDNLGADPVKALIHFTGIGALNLLLLTLLISPAARYLPAPALMRLRRMLGVYVFVYAFVHLLTYISFELQFDWSLVVSEIIKRPYITVGMAALLLLLALTMTSPNRVRQQLGKRWQSLHNTVYIALLLALLHFSWSRKTGLQEPLIYWGLALIILLPRLQNFRTRRGKRKN
ncbi:sulfite oxidase heme-binding subunit YedZ [Alteromonas lipolytica]|uniref:Protein-methionine-sulfoxide reductase heme-binding subunit MsrQ n=1 Tax=Alteromonas lipolytica TaxID=1856405 RepID=A0A1E8FIS5_9ALTE|nr:protein-methionine-sulfoxide reductase heme-binding subunit MsrQ [Alteromonas lipolytica]OFI35841.1 sulfoxide reductase heme-binding subunit YedZ [Alteromonas lipolytica]GGF81297.1 protein-methionine-sulfoxide reductase heme-binding subunit MsrQ [Alteromonas lipolytica]